ncbi:tetratricopeptide repeat protein [Streptomyces goshikiensis]|uniref:tetratricopeptide repeat protein n=1 Tax=Streptomyces goshikiensis TaxID=1942 RepID=UPI00369D1B58
MTITTTGVRVPSYLQDPRRWTLVEAWDALAAGTHRARPDEAGSPTPAYVARDIDNELRNRLTLAAQQGGLVLVLGESTAGKTRAAHHAVRECAALAGYRVLAPDTGPDLVIAVDVLTATLARCVVWLDDLERFLTPDGLEAGVLAELTRLKAPVLATMQLRHYDVFLPHTESSQDESGGLHAFGTGARVLKQTDPLYLQRRWSATELTRARDCDDPRIIDAVTHHGPYGVAEYLAAGPALLTEWRNASRPGAHPRGAALVAAAVDLTRTGLRPPYPTTLLTTLHQHYLPNDPLLRPEPIDTALAWAARLRYGATSLLLPTNNPDAYDVFDYLPDHTTSPVTENAWQSAMDHALDEEEQFMIGVHAYVTAPHIAEAAWRPLAQHNTNAAVNLGLLLAQTGRTEEAEEKLRQASDTGNINATAALGTLLAQAGRTEEAEEKYRQASDAGNTNATTALGLLLAQAGRTEEAVDKLRQASDAGDTNATTALGTLLAQTGRTKEAEEKYRQASDTGNTNATTALGALLAQTGRTKEAEEKYRQASDAGDINATTALGMLLAQVGRTEEAEEKYRQASDAGDINATTALGLLLAQAGRTKEAEEKLRQASDTGNINATTALGALLAQTGRTKEAEEKLRQASDTGDTNATTALGMLLAQTGRTKEAEEKYRQASDASNINATANLGLLLAQTGRTKEAEEKLRQASDTGSTNATANLGVLLAQTGRTKEAEEKLRQASDAGSTNATANLGVLLAQTGRTKEAGEKYRQASEDPRSPLPDSTEQPPSPPQP